MRYVIGDKIVFTKNYGGFKEGEQARIMGIVTGYDVVSDERTLRIPYTREKKFEGATRLVDNEDADKAKETDADDKTIRPDYYKFHGYDVFDIADYFGLTPTQTMAIKYILRHKDATKRMEDIKKARVCLTRDIELMEKRHMLVLPSQK